MYRNLVSEYENEFVSTDASSASVSGHSASAEALDELDLNVGRVPVTGYDGQLQLVTELDPDVLQLRMDTALFSQNLDI